MKSTPYLLVLVLASCGNITAAPLRLTEDSGVHVSDGGSAGDAAGELAAPSPDGAPGGAAGAGGQGGAGAGGQVMDAAAELPAPWPPAGCEGHPAMMTACGTFQRGLPCYICLVDGLRYPAAGGAPCGQSDGLCTASCGGDCL